MLYPHYVTAARICGCSIKVVEGMNNYFQLHCTEEENFQNNQIFLGFGIFSSAPKFNIYLDLNPWFPQPREIEECGSVEAAATGQAVSQLTIKPLLCVRVRTDCGFSCPCLLPKSQPPDRIPLAWHWAL